VAQWVGGSDDIACVISDSKGCTLCSDFYMLVFTKTLLPLHRMRQYSSFSRGSAQCTPAGGGSPQTRFRPLLARSSMNPPLHLSPPPGCTRESIVRVQLYTAVRQPASPTLGGRVLASTVRACSLHVIYFASAAVAEDSSRVTASSSASWSRFSLPSN